MQLSMTCETHCHTLLHTVCLTEFAVTRKPLQHRTQCHIELAGVQESLSEGDGRQEMELVEHCHIGVTVTQMSLRFQRGLAVTLIALSHRTRCHIELAVRWASVSLL